MSALPIISADQRMTEKRGIKGCIFGKSGIGKTSLLWTPWTQRTLYSLIWKLVTLLLKVGQATASVQKHAGMPRLCCVHWWA